jgi:hypothetical protein
LGALIQPQKHAGGLARSPVKTGKKSGLLDVRGKTVFECDDIVKSLSEGLAVIQRGDKYGYADTKGRIVIPPKYKAARNFSEGLAAVELDDKTFCIDKKGNIAVQCEYSITGEFSDGVATILQIVHRAKPDRLGMKDRFLHGIVNKQGKILIPPRFDSLSRFSNGRAVFALGEDADSTVYGIVDKAGNYVLKPTPKSFIGVYGGYGSLEHGFSDGLVVYADEAAMLNGYLDLDGRMAIPASKCRCEQGFAGRFSEGLAAITVGLGRERLRNLGRGGSFDTLPPDYMKVGYIDKTGEFAITPRFDGGQGRPFSEGLAAVRPTKDSKWGYIDRHGNMVISPQFDNAEEFTQGVAVVGVGKLYGLIDNTGAFVVKPQFARIGEFSDGLATFERP